MKLTPAWRNRLRNLTTIFLVLTMVAIIYTLIQWIRSEPDSFEPLNVLFFAVFSVASTISAWLSRPDNVQPPASSEIALAETPAFGPLRQQISDLFSLEELRVLCLDVGIRYDALSGNTIDTKVASLLAYADRREQLNQLMSALQQERPQTKWPIPNTLQTLFDLRRNVRATWIDGVLKQSVTAEIALELNLTLEPHVLTRRVAYVPGQADKLIEKEVPQLFADFGSLLILGEPGSGKTMTLLQLAESLLNDAEHDATLLTPVVLNLSSWANEQKPLVEWLVEELWQQYQLPRETGRDIIQSNQLIYLLDGLDEVAEAARDACVEVVSSFWEQYNGGLVVCCRVEEYEALSHKLNLGMGVRIQPLDKTQVAGYLQRPELALETIYKLWQTDEALQKLAQTPLFLSVFTLAYGGLHQGDLNQLDSEGAWQDHIYHHYVTMMFNRRPLLKKNNFAMEQAVSWLTNLAYGMKQNDQTIFFIERLQPTWLLTAKLLRNYNRLTLVVYSLIGGLIGMLLLGIIGRRIDSLIFGLIAGISVGLVQGLFFKEDSITLYDALSWASPPKLLQEIRGELIIRLRYRWLFFLIIVTIVILGGGLVGGLIVGFIAGLIFILILAFFGSAIIGIETCIQVLEQSNPLEPNRAIRNSLQSGILMFIIFGLVGFAVVIFINLIGGLILGLVIGLSFGFFQYGGQSFIKHYILRLILARSGIFPFATRTDREFTDFLDMMKDRIFLRRVGGGWIFIHRTLLEFFAALHPDAQVEVGRV